MTSREEVFMSKNEEERSTSRGKAETGGLRYDYKQELVKRYKYKVGGLNLEDGE